MAGSAGSARDYRKAILFAFVLGLGCYLAWLVRDVLLLLYVSALFAVVLSPLVQATAAFELENGGHLKGLPFSFCWWAWWCC